MSSYLEIEDALQVIDRYGFHIRDIGLLASALARPGTIVMGTEAYPQLPMKAAALLESVARFDLLIDGNRRTAWTLTVLMLWINGLDRTGAGSGRTRHVFATSQCFQGLESGSSPTSGAVFLQVRGVSGPACAQNPPKC